MKAYIADDCIHYGQRVRENIVVPEPQDPITVLFEPSCTSSVGFLRLGLAVLPAVQLDYELRAVIGKVRDVWADGGLLPEVKALAVKLTQLAP
jgi:hypothetical protein